MLLNDQWVSEKIRRILKQVANIGDIEKIVFRMKFKAIGAYITKN
jgi:hypothetical protein